MSKSLCSDSDAGESDTDWNPFELSQTALRTSRTPLAHDPRPLWQRLDDEEDCLLIKQRNLIRRIRIAVLAILGAAVFFWLINQ